MRKKPEKPHPQRGLALVVALAASLMLGGCSTAAPELPSAEGLGAGAQERAEELVEGLSGGNIDVSTGGDLAKDFPKEIPRIDGKILSSGKIGADEGAVWTATVGVPDPAAAMKEQREKMLAAGFEELNWLEGSVTMGSYRKGELTVSLIASKNIRDGEEPAISMTVIHQLGEE